MASSPDECQRTGIQTEPSGVMPYTSRALLCAGVFMSDTTASPEPSLEATWNVRVTSQPKGCATLHHSIKAVPRLALEIAELSETWDAAAAAGDGSSPPWSRR